MKINIGVEIGAKFIQVGLIDKYGRLLARSKMPSFFRRPLCEIIKDAVNLINSLLEQEDIDDKSIKSVGVACPGVIDTEEGKIVKTYVLGFHNVPIRDEFKAYFEVPIYVENDAHCAALAESAVGAAEDLDYSLTINIGTGVSGGIIIDNKIYTGYNGAGAVLGHMVIDKHGRRCSCGRAGCFEALCSAKTLIEETRKIAEKNPDSVIMEICNNDLSFITETTVYEAMNRGDIDAKDVFDTYVENLSIALANFANILMPEVIILCGGITALGENLLEPVRKQMSEMIFSNEIAMPMLKLSEMGSAAVLVGAGMLGTYRKL